MSANLLLSAAAVASTMSVLRMSATRLLHFDSGLLGAEQIVIQYVLCRVFRFDHSGHFDLSSCEQEMPSEKSFAPRRAFAAVF